METIKNAWKWVVAVIVGLVGIILFQRGKITDLLSKLLSKNNAIDDARLEERERQLNNDKHSVKSDIDEQRKKLHTLEETEKNADEVHDYWNKS